MAIGDDAVQGGLPIVPDSGEDGKIRYGAREINRTRDFVARKSKYGTTVPANTVGQNGDIFFKII